MEITGPLMFIVAGVFMMAMGVLALSFSVGLMAQEQKRHNKALEQFLAEIRDRQPEYVP